MPDTTTDPDKRRILLELKYIYTEDELCQKWGLTKYRLRQWKKAANFAYLSPTLRELVILALRDHNPEPACISTFIDHLDHTVYTEPEILDVLHALQSEGIAHEDGGEWRYNRDHSQNDTSFIF